MPLGTPEALVGVVFFLAGVVLVIVSVETFVEAVAESALALGISGFFLTVLLAGMDLENAVLGLAAVFDRLPALALGTVFGEALFILGAAVGLAGVIAPFETDVPRSYLLLLLGAPVLFLLLAKDGTLTRFDGALLTAGYLPALAVVYLLERGSETNYLSAEEVEELVDAEDPDVADAQDDTAVGATDDDGFDLDLDLNLDVDWPWLNTFRERNEGWYRLSIAVAAVLSMTVGSELTVVGARQLLHSLAISGLAFGATVMSFVASLEELFLTVEPVRQGRPHLAVGNVVGSVLFFVTANAGVLALVHPIDTSGTVVTVHWPFFIVSLLLVGGFLARGRVGRAAGAVLLGMYVAYIAVVLAGYTPV